MAGFTAQVKRILKDNNCYFKRQGRGDHEIWFSPNSNRSFTVDPKNGYCITAEAQRRRGNKDMKPYEHSPDGCLHES